MPEELRVNNGSRDLTLDELAVIQPGMGRLMPEVGERMWKTWYAARAGNWPLARFELKEGVNLLELGAFVRPKYEQNMTKFLEEDLAPVRKAIEARDPAAFETAFHAMVEKANAYHEVYDKGFIRWRIPDAPPPDLDLTPRG
jgi:hypothetical protein